MPLRESSSKNSGVCNHFDGSGVQELTIWRRAMWQSTETPDVSFLKLAGIALLVLALAAGSISLIGLTLAKPEPQLLAQQAVHLEQGTEALFRQVDAASAARHESIPEFTFGQVD
jgi:hypothetical protein